MSLSSKVLLSLSPDIRRLLHACFDPFRSLEHGLGGFVDCLLTVESNVGIFLLGFLLPFIALFSGPIHLFDTFVVETYVGRFTAPFDLFVLLLNALAAALVVLWQTSSVILFKDFSMVQLASFVLKANKEPSDERVNVAHDRLRTRRKCRSLRRASRSERLLSASVVVLSLFI